MGRSIGNVRTQGLPMPVVPTESKGIMSGPIRKPRRQGRRRKPRGSRPDIQLGRVTQPDGSTLITYGSSPRRKERGGAIGGRRGGGDIGIGGGPGIPPRFPSPEIGQRRLSRGEEEFGERLRREREAGINRTPEEQRKLYKEMVTERRRRPRRGPIGRRMPPKDIRLIPKETFRDGPRRRPLTGGYNPESGVRYTDTGVPTAVEQTTRVPVQDPTLGGPPEREVPIPRERRQKITRESDPRGAAPFSPDEKGMARDRFFERMFDRADEAKQQRSMEREDMRETRRAVRDEREARRSDPGEIDIDAERGGRRRRRRGRRRDFTRRRSQMEGGRRGRSREERAAFRDRYVSTLR